MPSHRSLQAVIRRGRQGVGHSARGALRTATVCPAGPPAPAATPARWRNATGLRQRQVVRAHPCPCRSSVAYCESRNRHYDHHGKVLRGRKNRNDIGIYQINRVWHERRAKTAGYDIWSPHGNAGYALWLYREHGIAPWAATARCQQYPRAAPWRRPADRALACPLFAATERAFDFFEGRDFSGAHQHAAASRQ